MSKPHISFRNGFYRLRVGDFNFAYESITRLQQKMRGAAIAKERS